MSIRNSAPAITRTVLVPADITLTQLHEVICTTFDFTGLQEHQFASGHAMARGSWSEEQEVSTTLPGLLIDPLGSATYHYGDNDDWTVTIENLGFPHDRMLVPKLVDATGPDVLEGCGGPEHMTAMRDCAVRAVAEINLDLDVADLINTFLPGLAPELVIQRLTHTDPATVAGRVCYSMTPQYIDGLGDTGRTHGDGTSHDPFSHPDDWPTTDTRATANGIQTEMPAELPEQLPIEDRQDLNAQTIAEIRDALRNVPEAVPTGESPATALDSAAAEAVTESVRWLIDYVGDGLPLTQAGYLKPADVAAIAGHIEAEKYWIGRLNREVETIPVQVLREALIHMKLLRTSKGKVKVTGFGRNIQENPLDLARFIASQLPLLYDVTELAALQRVFTQWYQGSDAHPDRYPGGYGDNHHLLLAMNVLDREVSTSGPNRATPAGRAFIAEVLNPQKRA